MIIEAAMRLAIQEAYKGASFVSPNPLVGCVILNEKGDLIQVGHHETYGGPHAEVNALKGLTPEQLKGAHVIVTLEPCAHQGKTPSCAKTLAQLPIKKVTYGLTDPNPLVAGQGAAILQAAGIEAEVFHSLDPEMDREIKEELEQVCEAFLKNFRQQKIFVALKMASSLDGQIALKSGESRWITGPESREQVHYLRSCYDAVLVGRNTVKNDDPSLNIRHPHIKKENKIVVIDPEGEQLPRFARLKLAQTHAAKNIFWAVAEQQDDKTKKILAGWSAAPNILKIKTKISGELDLEDLLNQLWQAGLRSLMVEGGAMTASAFLQERLVDRLLLFQAPILLGSGGGLSWTSGLRIAKMQEKIFLEFVKTQSFGQDILIAGRVNYSNLK